MTIWIIKAFFICGIYVQNRMKNEDQNCPSFCSPTVSIRIDLLIDNRLMCAAVVLIPAIWYCGRGFMKALALLVWDEKQWGTDWIQWIDQRILDRRASSLPPREHHHHKMFGSSKKINRDVDNILFKKFKPSSSHIFFASTFGQTC